MVLPNPISSAIIPPFIVYNVSGLTISASRNKGQK